MAWEYFIPLLVPLVSVSLPPLLCLLFGQYYALVTPPACHDSCIDVLWATWPDLGGTLIKRGRQNISQPFCLCGWTDFKQKSRAGTPVKIDVRFRARLFITVHQSQVSANESYFTVIWQNLNLTISLRLFSLRLQVGVSFELKSWTTSNRQWWYLLCIRAAYSSVVRLSWNLIFDRWIKWTYFSDPCGWICLCPWTTVTP